MPEQTKGSPRAAFSFSRPPASAPLPGLAASAASRLPRWALIGLLALYVLHGLFHRDAWRGDDLIGLALARSTVEAWLSGNVSAALMASPEGLAWNGQGPLWVTILALFILPAYLWADLQQAPVPLTLLDDLARGALAITLALGFLALWKATDRFARRREAQPVDPLGVGPKSQDFGKTLADCALLLAIATLGVIYPWHQAGTAAMGFLWQGLLLWALATAPETPKRAATQCAWIIAASLLTQGPAMALANGLMLLVVFTGVAPYRMVARSFAPRCAAQSLLVIGVWTGLTMMALPLAHVAHWWAYSFADWSILKWLAMDPGTWRDMRTWINESLWRWWPLWPIAVYGLWKARGTGFTAAPHWIVPAIAATVLTVLGAIGPSDWNIHEIAPVAALAILSAFSLLSLPRAIVNLIDWFAVALFTALGIFIWLYWMALNFGFPQTLAQRVALLAPGVTGNANIYEVMMGALATIAWMALIIWRIRRGSPRLWRPVVLSAGGLTLLWVLLTTLWLPAIDRIQGQQTLARSLETAWLRAAELRLHQTPEQLRSSLARGRQGLAAGINDRGACVQISKQSATLDAIAVGLTNLPIANRPDCIWQLATFRAQVAQDDEWKTIWQSSVSLDRRTRERFVLLERRP